jgi:hypothetical protein
MIEGFGYISNFLVVERGKQDCAVFGKQSTELFTQENRISSIVACFYSREYQIPDAPSKNLFMKTVMTGIEPKKLKFEPFGQNDDISSKSINEAH